LNIDINTLYQYIYYLNRGKIFNILDHKAKGDNGDFLINEKYLFEIGEKNKSFKQIKDIPNSFIVSDDIEIGFGNKIPLWLFGFLY